jgi:hypothetical protein
MKLIGQPTVCHNDQPALHGLAVLGFVGLLQLFRRDGELVSGHLSQSKRGPEDVPLVLFDADAALTLEHVEPLLATDLESGGHAIDFSVDFLVRDRNATVPAVMQNQPLIHQAFEHLFPEAIHAGRSKCVFSNVLTIDDGHHIVLRPLASRHFGTNWLSGRLLAGCGAFGLLCGRFRCGRLFLRTIAAERIGKLRLGGAGTDEASQYEAQADHR